MSDESFFREVNEEIRQERTRLIWSRFGRWIIALAIFAVVATAAYVGWSAYQSSRADASGDRYLAAIDLAKAGKADEALAGFRSLSEDGYGPYRDLARMRIATVKEAAGDQAAAVTAFDAIANDRNAPQPIRDMASVRAAYVLVDTGSLDDVRARVETLSADGEPLRYAAREALGLSAWRAGNVEEAKRFFELLRDDQGTPAGIGLRTRVMLELLAAGSQPLTTPAAPVADMPATDALILDAPTMAPVEAPAPATPSAETPAAPAAETPATPAMEAAPVVPAEPTPAPVETPATPQEAPAAEPTPAAPDAPAPAATSVEPPAPAVPAAPTAETPPVAPVTPDVTAPAPDVAAPTTDPVPALPSVPAAPETATPPAAPAN